MVPHTTGIWGREKGKLSKVNCITLQLGGEERYWRERELMGA
jgi:hypothetical protein